MNTKTKTFRVPTDIAIEFAHKMAEFNLPCELMGANKKEELLYEVDYKPSERNKVHDLIDLIDDYWNEVEEDEEDETEDEEDEEENDD